MSATNISSIVEECSGQQLPLLLQHLVIKLENCCPVFACGDNISWFQTVQNICSGHSILFSIIHLYCWKYCTIENIYYFLNFPFFVFNGISKGYIYNIFEWKQLLFKFNTVECLSTLTIKLKHFKFADQILGNYSRTLVWLFHWK